MIESIFVNRILNMKKIKTIGLDMDHTLIRYHTRHFESTVYHLVLERLIQDKQYPLAIRDFTFNFDLAIRGLVVDCRNGNLLKLSRFAGIKQSYHGSSQIPFKKQQTIYQGIYIDLGRSDYIVIDTAFSISFCSIYAQLVDFKDSYPALLPSYAVIAQDVLQAVDVIHANGSLKTMIASQVQDFVIQDPDVVAGLKRYRRYGKKIFILTNSDFYYTKVLLDYALTPFLAPGEHWSDLFEYIITLANKPRFFYDNLHFLSVSLKDGHLMNCRGKLVPGIYQGGNAKKFTQDLQLSGDDILYIGDHIYGDVVRLKKECNWRTALVIEELGAELHAQAQSMPVEQKITSLMHQKEQLESKYVALCSLRLDQENHANDEDILQLQNEIAQLDRKLAVDLQQKHHYFNPFWDSAFRAGAEESFFASQVDRYACIYMEKLSDLLRQSPMTYYRAFHRPLPHEHMLPG